MSRDSAGFASVAILKTFNLASINPLDDIAHEPQFEMVCSLTDSELHQLFSTIEPTRSMVESVLLNEQEIEDWEPWEKFWDGIDHGEGRYIIVYENGQPTEIFFAGYSFD